MSPTPTGPFGNEASCKPPLASHWHEEATESRLLLQLHHGNGYFFKLHSVCTAKNHLNTMFFLV
ncbi:MAG: hypothetical protein CO119_03425 [Flavobacteriales bacterium CG_4_9_14_3_um_filter_40_17]|nr:MAG: hypothetical protein CO119_03425 [Flavobacteriales bacterium CG_4_9_14_3_um_filter_40_17]